MHVPTCLANTFMFQRCVAKPQLKGSQSLLHHECCLSNCLQSRSQFLDWNIKGYRVWWEWHLDIWKSESVHQSCPTLCNPMDCSLPGSSVHGILQARILEWVAISYSRGSFWSRDRTQVSCIAGGFFTIWATNIYFANYFLNKGSPATLRLKSHSDSMLDIRDMHSLSLPC